MSEWQDRGLWSALAWFVFPAVPVVLARTYHDVLATGNLRGGPDPFDWDWQSWLIEIGPLVGFGFLIGATLGLSDDPSGRRGLRGWFAKRSIWVAVGPWSGMLVWLAFSWLFLWSVSHLPNWVNERINQALEPWKESWTSWTLGWIFMIVLYVTFPYAWLFLAIATMRRARRIGRVGTALKRGLTVAIGFAGSLFGSFWAITQVWRDYFFDTRIVPIVLAMVSLAALSGCSSTITYGEVRRRELFGAMLISWVFGLALAWRWLSRRRPNPPDSSA